MQEYSTTFYECVQDWPKEIQEDIYAVYAYLRAMDEGVENDNWHPNFSEICENFNIIADKYQFEEEWVKDFDKVMLGDLLRKKHTVVSMLEYCKGSAEVVGLMVSRILGCSTEGDPYARCLGRAYQIINFIRDWDEDMERGYQYIGPKTDIYYQLFFEELTEAMKGIQYIPEELRGPILKANDKYLEIANETRILQGDVA